MRCPKCGGDVDDDAKFCQFCGEKITANAEEPPRSLEGGDGEKRTETPSPTEREPGSEERPHIVRTVLATRPRRDPDYLWGSFLAIVFCSPLAIVPVVLAFSARSRYAQADYAASQKLARTARICFWLSVLIGTITQSVYIHQHWDEFVRTYYDALAAATGVSPDGDPERKFDSVDVREDGERRKTTSAEPTTGENSSRLDGNSANAAPDDTNASSPRDDGKRDESAKRAETSENTSPLGGNSMNAAPDDSNASNLRDDAKRDEPAKRGETIETESLSDFLKKKS